MTYDPVRSGNRILIVGCPAIYLTYAWGKSYEAHKKLDAMLALLFF